MNEIISYIIVLICMIPLFLFRKKVSFLFCPNEVMGRYTKNKYFGIYSLMPSFVIVAYLSAQLRLLMESNVQLKVYSNYVLVVAAILLFGLLFLFGVITDWFLYHSNKRYKDWIDINKK